MLKATSSIHFSNKAGNGKSKSKLIPRQQDCEKLTNEQKDWLNGEQLPEQIGNHNRSCKL